MRMRLSQVHKEISLLMRSAGKNKLLMNCALYLPQNNVKWKRLNHPQLYKRLTNVNYIPN